MITEMQALEHSKTSELVPLPFEKKTVGCHWVYAIKVRPNDEVDRVKARLVAIGYTWIYELDYSDNFSPVEKITTIIAMAAIRHCPFINKILKMFFCTGI